MTRCQAWLCVCWSFVKSAHVLLRTKKTAVLTKAVIEHDTPLEGNKEGLKAFVLKLRKKKSQLIFSFILTFCLKTMWLLLRWICRRLLPSGRTMWLQGKCGGTKMRQVCVLSVHYCVFLKQSIIFPLLIIYFECFWSYLRLDLKGQDKDRNTLFCISPK